MMDSVDKKSGCPVARSGERAEARLRWLRIKSQKIASARGLMAAYGRPMRF